MDLRADGSYVLAEPELGDTVAELLGYVHFDPAELRRVYREKVAAAVPPERAEAVLAELEAGLNGYTYLED